MRGEAVDRRRFLYRVAGLTLGLLMPGEAVRASETLPEGEGGLFLPRVDDTAAVDSRTIYLTFDDGYIGLPEKIAAVNALGVTATFFLTGQVVRAHARDVVNLVNSGHVIGNHTYDHSDLTKLSYNGIAYQLQTCENIVQNVVGVSTQPLMRPTFGNVNSFVRNTAADLGYRSILWDWDTRDWAGSSASYIEQNFGTGIVLMHTQGRNTVAALDDVIPGLAYAGYVFSVLG